MSTGLVLGKFAPLHRGHQLLIETALRENALVLVMVYHAPEVTSIPLPRRAGWIRALYPGVQVIEAWDGPLEVGDTPVLRALHEEYILRVLDGRRVDNFYSSEFYGAHVSAALGARDCRVDPTRTRVPISATAIRAHPFANRAFLDPVVYRDLVARVALVGAPSTGKTALASALATAYHTTWMPEYGREYWEAHQRERRLTAEQLVEIAEEHRRREDAMILDADRLLFVDTDATTTAMFARYYHGHVLPRLADLAADARDRYRLHVLCEDDIPYEDTPDRSGAVNRSEMQAATRADLAERGIEYVAVKGSLDERITALRPILAAIPPA